MSVCHIPAAELFPALSPRAVDGLRLAADWCAGWINSQWPQAERYVGAELPASALSLAIGAYEAHEPMATSICPPLRGRLEKAAALEAEPWEDAADALWTVAE